MNGPSSVPDTSVVLRRPVPERAARGLLSVVIPCHNERDVIEATHARLVEVLPATGMDFEIIYIDDGSRDRQPCSCQRRLCQIAVLSEGEAGGEARMA